MLKKIFSIFIVLLLGSAVAFFVVRSEPKFNPSLTLPENTSFLKKFPFRLGLDLSGGSHLVYKADVSAVPNGEVSESMDALRDVIERRVNLFGVSEPLVQRQSAGFISGGEEKLIVDLPGVTDVNKAAEMIGQTPLLEFKVETPGYQIDPLGLSEEEQIAELDNRFVSTDLTGRYLKKATLVFDPNTGQPQVSLKFDATGTDLFAKITRENVGKLVAIYLDGAPISAPVVREEISNGEAVISGNFNPSEGKQLVGRLNSGALPVPITLISRQTIGATLGDDAVKAGVKAAIVGFSLIVIFLVLWYRLPGFIAVLSLFMYVIAVLAIFKLLPVTLTAADIAGFIISIGIAVDANILIFERMKEEMRRGHTIKEALDLGFGRAWSSIRDSNISTIISAIIFFWFGTSLIQGFALTLGIGVLVSMFSAVMISRIFLQGFMFVKESKFTRFLFSSGISRK